MPPQLFRNLGKGRFEDQSENSGDYFRKEWLGRGSAFGDFDNDGRTDILVTHNDGPPALLKNVSDQDRQNHSLNIILRPEKVSGKAVSPVGVVVKVRLSDQQTLVRQVVAGTSYLSSHDSRLWVGTGGFKVAQSVDVRWPSGKQETWSNVVTDQLLELVEGRSPEISVQKSGP